MIWAIVFFILYYIICLPALREQTRQDKKREREQFRMRYFKENRRLS